LYHAGAARGDHFRRSAKLETGKRNLPQISMSPPPKSAPSSDEASS
jgi:hypothetical protein